MPDILHPAERIADALESVERILERQNGLLESINYTLQNQAPQPIVVEQRGSLTPTHPTTYIN